MFDLALNEGPVHAADAHRQPAQGVDVGHDFLVDHARQHRDHHLQRGFVGDALAIDELGGDTTRRQPVGYHLATAVDDDNRPALLLEGDDILQSSIVVAQGGTAELDYNYLAHFWPFMSYTDY